MYSSLFDGKEIPKNESKAGGDYVKFDAMRRLSDSVEEGHDLTARAGLVDAELTFSRSARVAGRNSFLLCP